PSASTDNTAGITYHGSPSISAFTRTTGQPFCGSASLPYRLTYCGSTSPGSGESIVTGAGPLSAGGSGGLERNTTPTAEWTRSAGSAPVMPDGNSWSAWAWSCTHSTSTRNCVPSGVEPLPKETGVEKLPSASTDSTFGSTYHGSPSMTGWTNTSGAPACVAS